VFRVDFAFVLGPGDLVRLVVFDVCALGVVCLAGLRDVVGAVGVLLLGGECFS